MNTKYTVKIFSHNDLDGYSCNMICDYIYDQVDKENVSVYEINNRIKIFIEKEEYKKYDLIFITDISVNEEVAEMIDKLYKQGYSFILIDHHKTALYLNKYEWCWVSEYSDGKLACGTKKLYYILNNLIDISIMEDYIETVNQYDTWLWEKYNNEKPKKVNNIFNILGPERFIKQVHKASFNVDEIIKNNSMLLELEDEKIESYIQKKNKEIIPINDIIIENKKYNIGIVFAEKYQSQLGNTLCKLNLQYDLIAMINGSKVSYRTIKNNIDLSIFAKYYNGGGHKKASGSNIDEQIIIEYLSNYFKGGNKHE